MGVWLKRESLKANKYEYLVNHWAGGRPSEDTNKDELLCGGGGGGGDSAFATVSHIWFSSCVCLFPSAFLFLEII